MYSSKSHLGAYSSSSWLQNHRVYMGIKKKLRPDGTVDKYKVKLVVKVFIQKSGINYFNVYFQ